MVYPVMKMGISYLDMMIIHSPQPWAEVNQSSNRCHEENRQVWRALEAVLTAGKVRAVGVSNFLKEDMDSLLETAKIKPMVNQVLCHISNTPIMPVQYCQSREIVMEAYSPIFSHTIAPADETEVSEVKVKITIGETELIADMEDNVTTQVIIEQMPMTLPMMDMKLGILHTGRRVEVWLSYTNRMGNSLNASIWDTLIPVLRYLKPLVIQMLRLSLLQTKGSFV